MRWAGLILLVAAVTATADVKIAKDDRVANQKPGYCAWCALETLGRHHGVKKLFGLVEARKKEPGIAVNRGGEWHVYDNNPGHDVTIQEKLDRLGVKYRMAATGSHDQKLMKYAMDNDLGFVGAVKKGAVGDEAHAVVVVRYTDKEVRYIDSNDTDSVYTVSRAWWDKWSDGSVLVIERPTADGKLSTPPGGVRPVILGLDLKEIDPEKLKSAKPEVDIIQYQLSKEKR